MARRAAAATLAGVLETQAHAGDGVARSDRPVVASYSIAGTAPPELAGIVADLVEALADVGFVPAEDGRVADVVLNVVDPAAPRPFRRRSKATFVAALWSVPDVPEDGLHATYPMLV